MKKLIKYIISYAGTAATVYAIFNKEAASLINPSEGQIIVIAGFNIGAALLFVLAGLMDPREQGYNYILGFAIVSRVWTFFHITVLFSGWVMWEMIALNIVVIGFELSNFFIARGETLTKLKDDKIYKTAYDAIMSELSTQFPKYPQLQGEPVDTYVKRIREEIDNELSKKPKEVIKEVEVVKEVVVQKPVQAARKAKPKARGKSEEELLSIYKAAVNGSGKDLSSRELAKIWECSPSTAISWKEKLGLTKQLNIS